MRGSDALSVELFSSVNLEKRLTVDHPLGVIRETVNATPEAAEFDALYSPFGRDFLPLEWLLRALLRQAFSTICSGRQLVERIDFDLLLRRFMGLGMDEPMWDATRFTKNRELLLAGEIAASFFPVRCPRSRRSRRYRWQSIPR